MEFPFSFLDLSVWLGTAALVLLAASELLSPYYGQTGFVLQEKRLRVVAMLLSILFMITIAIQIYWTIAKIS